MAITLLDIFTDALGEIGVLASGAVPDAAMSAHALRRVNDLIGQEAVEPGSIFKVTRTTWTIVSGTQNYSVGASQTVNFARPALDAVQSIAFVDTSSDPDLEFGGADPLTEDEWAEIAFKAQTDTLPLRAYYNPTYPTGLISLWPVPTSATLLGVLYAHEAVAEFAAASDTISLPAVYRGFLVKNLAVDLAPSYQRTPSPLLMLQARETKATLRASNFRVRNTEFPADALIGSSRGAYNIKRE